MTRPLTSLDPLLDVRPEFHDAVYAFEGIDAQWLLVPLAARRILDAWGAKLSLAGWLSLSLEDRHALVRAGLAELAKAPKLRPLADEATAWLAAHGE